METGNYILKKVSSILEEYQNNLGLGYSLASCWCLADNKGFDLKIIDVSKASSLGDYYILVSAENTRQSEAMAQNLMVALKYSGRPPLRSEGLDTGNWILIDFGDIIVHIFEKSSRQIYDLDALWMAFPKIPIPEEYYFSSPVTESIQAPQKKTYF